MQHFLHSLLVLAFSIAVPALHAQETADDSTPGGLKKMPELTEFIEADYPDSLVRLGIEGTVTMDLLISDSGTVESVAVVQGVTPSLDRNAADAARRFTFTPAVAGGEPVAVLLQYAYRFSLDDAVKTVEDYVNFEGRLLERGTRRPIADAMVVVTFTSPGADTALPLPFGRYLEKLDGMGGQILDENRLVATTGADGSFRFHALPAGSIRVTTPLPGYEQLDAAELITRGEAVTATYRLRNVSGSDYEVVAYGREEKREVSRRQLSVTEVKKVPGTGGDAIKVVQSLPGVARPSFGSGAIIVRGSGQEDTRYFLDGVEIPSIFHVGQLKSTYNADLLGSIDMYPGGFNARYGGAVGGVIEITGRAPRTDRWHGKADVNLLDASFLAEGPLTDKLSLAVTTRRSYFDVLLEAALKDAPTTIQPVYNDMVARLEYRPNAADRMFLTAFSSTDELEIIMNGIRGGSDEISDGGKGSHKEYYRTLIAGFDKALGTAWNNELRTAYKYGGAEGGYFGMTAFDFAMHTGYLRDELSWTPAEGTRLAAGLDLDLDHIDYEAAIMSSSGPIHFTSDALYSNLGAYVNAEVSPLPGLKLIPGIRYDHYVELDEGTPTYRLTGRYEYRDGHTVKTALGTYSQSPKPYGQAIDSAWGNPDLPPTRATHAVAGYEWRLSDLVSLDAQAYYNRQYDIPRPGSEINPATGKPYNFLPDAEGRMYGLELMLRHDQGRRFFGWLAYSLSRSERRSPAASVSQQGRGGAWDPDAWTLYGMDQTHNLQLVGNWRLPRSWETGFRFRYVTGNPYTPNLAYTENRLEYDADYARYVQLEGEALSDRMEPFLQLDVRMEKKFVFKTWILTSYLDLQNVNYFFYNSPEFYTYNYDGTEREAVGGIMIPAAGVCVEF